MNRHTKAHFQKDANAEQTARFHKRGAFIVVHQTGPLANSPGTAFTTALVALPNESTDDCIRRHGYDLDPNDVRIDFSLNIQ